MPKTPSTASPSSQSHRELVLNNAAQAGVLKRNQVCPSTYLLAEMIDLRRLVTNAANENW
jgi:hypothetical protein